MAAAIDSIAYNGAKPWHGLGQEVSGDSLFNYEIMLKEAGLDWQVELEPVFLADGTKLPDTYSTTRTKNNQKDILGVVGGNYKILQNADCLRWFQPFLDTGDVQFETAGALSGGSIVWALARMNGNIDLGDGDKVNQYILLSHSHNGRYSVEARLTPIRVVCQNTLTMARAAKSAVFGKIKHTQSMEYKLDQARVALAQANDIFLAESEKYKFLASKLITTQKADQYFRQCLGIDQDKAPEELHGKTINTLNQVKTLFFTGKGAELSTASGTYWGAFNAIEEYNSWYRGRTKDSRLESVWFGEAKTDPLSLALSMAS